MVRNIINGTRWSYEPTALSGDRGTNVGSLGVCGVKLWLCNFFLAPNTAILFARLYFEKPGFSGVQGIPGHGSCYTFCLRLSRHLALAE